MTKFLTLLKICGVFLLLLSTVQCSMEVKSNNNNNNNNNNATSPPIYIAFHFHLHQPIYYPTETLTQTIDANRFPQLLDIFTSRAGPYTSWPVDAIETAQQNGLSHCGAQVSFTGALQQNLNNLIHSNLTNDFDTYTQRWVYAQQKLRTSLNNAAIDMTAFGHFHPLMPLTDSYLISLQILLHRLALSLNFGIPIDQVSRGLFPPENAFSPRMIPALLAANITWVLIDNIHFDRAHLQYPFTTGSNLYPPNPADQRNNQTTSWVQLNDLWAPGKVSAPFGYRPYWIEYVDPATAQKSRILGVPGARYEGVEDGRGGYGAFLYEQVMSQYLFANNDDTRPMMVLLAHDGDNYGGGTDSYYHNNFDNFVNWQKSTSQYVCTTVDDYLATYPVPDTEVIHVEDGSWSGANNGDPQFLKWNPNFFSLVYEPERNSWAVINAAVNRVLTAQQIAPWSSLNNIYLGLSSASSTPTELAFHFLLTGQASDYWYWPTEQVWNSDPTVAANTAAIYADKVINSLSNNDDHTPPNVFVPQRQYWNPGAVNWNPRQPDPADFGIWTLVYDVNSVTQVQLKIRVSAGQLQPTDANLIYGDDSQWTSIDMVRVPLTGSLAPQTDPLPTYISDLYQANVTSVRSSLVDYYVYAVDSVGNVQRTDIQHVYVGSGSS